MATGSAIGGGLGMAACQTEHHAGDAERCKRLLAGVGSCAQVRACRPRPGSRRLTRLRPVRRVPWDVAFLDNRSLHDNFLDVIVRKESYDARAMENFEAEVRAYLQQVLGLRIQDATPWAGADELPYFLRDAFRFSEMVLLGQGVVLAFAPSAQRPPLSEIRRWMDKVRAVSGKPVIYGTDALASYERKRLIEHRVPFVVPGNQLYLPDLGLDLREYFRQRAPAAEEALSPSAQAVLISVLLRQPWQAEWQASAIGSALGYTAMTMSRVVRELAKTGLAKPYAVGRSRWLRMDSHPRQIWERAAPLMRTPVKRTVWVPGSANAVEQLRLAGLSALSRHTLVAEPTTVVYAAGPAEWKAASKVGMQVLPEPTPAAHEWQLWAYSPALGPERATVDPLSLILSLQDSTDDRVRMALDELKEQLPW